jgi:hypothetical protein
MGEGDPRPPSPSAVMLQMVVSGTEESKLTEHLPHYACYVHRTSLDLAQMAVSSYSPPLASASGGPFVMSLSAYHCFSEMTVWSSHGERA